MWEGDEIGYTVLGDCFWEVRNAEKWGEHKKRKLLINNSFEAVTLFK